MNPRVTTPCLLVLLVVPLLSSVATASHSEVYSLEEAKQLAAQSGSKILVETFAFN